MVTNGPFLLRNQGKTFDAVLHIYAFFGPFLEPFSKGPTYDLKVPI